MRTLAQAAMWRPGVIVSGHVNLAPLLTVAGGLCRARTVMNVYGMEIWSGLGERRRAHLGRVDRITALRTHLQSLDDTAKSVQAKSASPHLGLYI
jgi:hypothetical protein